MAPGNNIDGFPPGTGGGDTSGNGSPKGNGKRQGVAAGGKDSPIMDRQTAHARVLKTDGGGGVNIDRVSKQALAWHHVGERWTSWISVGKTEYGDWEPNLKDEHSTAVWFGHRLADQDKVCKAFLSQVFVIPRRAHRYGSDPDGNPIHRLGIGINRAHFHHDDNAHGVLHHIGTAPWVSNQGFKRMVLMHHWTRAIGGDDKWHWYAIVPSGVPGDPENPGDPSEPPGPTPENPGTQPTGPRGGPNPGVPNHPSGPTQPTGRASNPTGGGTQPTTGGTGGTNPSDAGNAQPRPGEGGLSGSNVGEIGNTPGQPGAGAPISPLPLGPGPFAPPVPIPGMPFGPLNPGGFSGPPAGGTRINPNPNGGTGDVPTSGAAMMAIEGGGRMPTPASRLRSSPGQASAADRIGTQSLYEGLGTKTINAQESSPRMFSASRWTLGTQPNGGAPFLPGRTSRWALGTPYSPDSGLLEEAPTKETGIDWTDAGVAADLFEQLDVGLISDNEFRPRFMERMNATVERTHELDARERANYHDDIGTVVIAPFTTFTPAVTALPTEIGSAPPRFALGSIGVGSDPFISTLVQAADGTWSFDVNISLAPGPAIVEVDVEARYPVASDVTIPC